MVLTYLNLLKKTILEWTLPVYDTEILEELPDYCGKCKVTFDRKKVTYFY